MNVFFMIYILSLVFLSFRLCCALLERKKDQKDLYMGGRVQSILCMHVVLGF